MVVVELIVEVVVYSKVGRLQNPPPPPPKDFSNSELQIIHGQKMGPQKLGKAKKINIHQYIKGANLKLC